MKLFLKIITDPFGIAISIVHWIVVVFAFYSEGNPFERNALLCMHCRHLITDWLFVANSIPLILIQIIGDLLQSVFGMNHFIDIHLQFLCIFFIIVQWFLVGFLLNLIIEHFKSDKIHIPFN